MPAHETLGGGEAAGMSPSHPRLWSLSNYAPSPASLFGRRRYLAYGGLDLALARDAAPWAAFGNPARQDFFSARIGCQVYQPLYEMDFAALCLRS